MQRYIALIHKEKKSSYGVMFPDFPGCVSAGDSIEDTMDAAREALAFHAEGMRNDGEDIPEPRSVDEIRNADEDWYSLEDAIVVAIPLLPPKGDSVRVNINLDRNLLAAVDADAEKGNQTRSAYIARALETALSN